jgi:alpha-1,4-digalacturonate transport system permease protein
VRFLALFFNLFEPLFRLSQKWLGQSRLAWLFVGPNLLVFGVFTFLPIIINVLYATSAGVALMPSERPYLGLENFEILFECRDYFDFQSCRKDVFWRAIANTLKFIIGRGFWRGVFFYPVLLSPVVVALIWKWLLQSQGVFNAVLISMNQGPVDWLTDRHWAFFWTIFVSIWAHMGFYTLILLAGLQAIPKDVYEAALMDKASPWRTLTHITLPLLMPNLIVVLVLAMIRAVQVFDEVFVLTGGGPGSARVSRILCKRSEC